MSNMIKGAYPVFTDIDGSPIEDGYIFIGEPTLDPITNPIDVYWDEELTVPATNIRTKGGYPNNSGVPGRLFVEGTYSILVQNKRGTEVYSETTFFESGEELSLNGKTNTQRLPLDVHKVNDQTLRITFVPEQTPKQGTGISIITAGTIIVIAGGVTYSFIGSETYGSPLIKSDLIQFEISTAAAALAGIPNNTSVYMTSSNISDLVITG